MAGADADGFVNGCICAFVEPRMHTNSRIEIIEQYFIEIFHLKSKRPARRRCTRNVRAARVSAPSKRRMTAFGVCVVTIYLLSPTVYYKETINGKVLVLGLYV